MTLPVPADGEWLDVADTQLGPKLATTAELGAAWSAEVGGAPTSWSAWCGLAFDTNLRKIYSLRPGGHADWAGADSYAIALNDLTTGWTRVEPVQHLTVQTGQLKNGLPCCNWPTYGPPATHTYGGVLYLGNQRYLHMGSPGGCNNAVMNPGGFAYFADTSTDPFTWTPVPALNTYAGVAAAALDGQYIYVVEDKGKWAKVDKDTGALVANGIVGAAKVGGVTMSGFSSFNAQMSAGDINSDGIFCTANEVAIGCSDINGTNSDVNNNTLFGKFIRRPFGGGFSGGKAGITRLKDGWFVFWQGGKDIWLYKPDFLVPANDQWVHYAPATGPTPQNVHTYQKLFWDDVEGLLVGYSNSSENLWVFKVPGFGPSEVESLPLPFEERAAGALFSTTFNTQPPTGTNNGTPDAVFMNGGMANNQNPVMPYIEDGTLRFDYLSNTNASACGQYWVPFEDCLLGETIHVSWRQKVNAAFVQTAFERNDNDSLTSPKLLVMGVDNTSNCPQEFAITTANMVSITSKCPAMYNNGNFFEQITRLINWPLPIDQWVTYTLSITKPTEGYQSGQFVRYDVHIVLQAKPDGEDVITIVDTVKPCRSMNLPNNAAFFTPYMTKKDPAQVHDTVSVWIDDVIISKQPIPFP
jgi:hypothetical protein